MDIYMYMCLNDSDISFINMYCICNSSTYTCTICDRICENQAYGIIINFEIRVKIGSYGLLR